MIHEPTLERQVLRGAHVPGSTTPVDILVEGGLVASVVNSKADSQNDATIDLTYSGWESVDLRGHLLLPALIEHHAHLDKVLTADVIVNETGDLMGAIDAWIRAEEAGVVGIEEMQLRAERALQQLVFAGVTSVRTHVNVGGSDQTLRNLRAVEAARKTFVDLIDVEVVALMHSPVSGRDGRENRLALDKALEHGIDYIGGCPHLESDSAGMIMYVLDVAQTAGLPLDLHVDESLDPNTLTVEILARAILEKGFEHRVTASHCVSLSMQPIEEQRRLADLLKQAQVRVVALPQTNLFLQGWNHPCATPRGIAPLSVLKEHGVEVAAGGDNVQDPFNPMGRNDPLETASLLVTAGHLDPLVAFDAVASRPISNTDFLESSIGHPANFLSIEADSVRGALAVGATSRRTIRHGRLIAQTSVERHLVRSDSDPVSVIHSGKSRRSSS